MSSEPPAIDLDRLVRAIAHVETGTTWVREGGALNISITDWREFAHLRPYALAQHEAEAMIVAKVMIDSAFEAFLRWRVVPTVPLLAQAWQSGVSEAMRRGKENRWSLFAAEVWDQYLNS